MFTLLDLKKASLRACAMRYLEASINLRSIKCGAALAVLGDPKNDITPAGNTPAGYTQRGILRSL